MRLRGRRTGSAYHREGRVSGGRFRRADVRDEENSRGSGCRNSDDGVG